MSLSERLLAFTLLGSEWVLWLLVLLSILSVAVMVERGLTVRARHPDFERVLADLLGHLTRGDLAGARKLLGEPTSPEARVALVGLDAVESGRDAASEAMQSARTRERMQLEKRLGILGTLGNNAPFIGLFGTVLGVIRAFADLSKNRGDGASAVMAGISEALVATAVGLLVAIPAVVAYNVLQGRIRVTLSRVDAVAHLILAAATRGK